MSLRDFQEFYKGEKFAKTIRNEVGDATAWTSFGYVFQELISSHFPGVTGLLSPLVVSAVMLQICGAKPSAKIRFDK